MYQFETKKEIIFDFSVFNVAYLQNLKAKLHKNKSISWVH